LQATLKVCKKDTFKHCILRAALPFKPTNLQVLRMLRKHGLVDGGVKRVAHQLRELSPTGDSDEEGAGGHKHSQKAKRGQRAGSEDDDAGEAAASRLVSQWSGFRKR
jgi:hypothetical protein